MFFLIKNHKLNMEKWEKTYTKNKEKMYIYNALTDAKITDKTYILSYFNGCKIMNKTYIL